MKKKRKNSERSTPWGRVCALLAACFATLVGVASGLEPDVILLRSLLAAVAVGFVACATNATVRALL